MQLKPVHKMALAGSVAALLMSSLVFVGFAWGSASGRGEERLLSVKMNKDAHKRMAAAAPRGAAADSDEDEAADEDAVPQRLTKLRYIAWLEKQLANRTEAVARLEKQAGQAAVSTAQYAEFARLVVTASRPAAQADNSRRPLVSKVAVQVLSDYWRDTYGAPLALPEDLFVQGFEGPAPAAASAALGPQAQPPATRTEPTRLTPQASRLVLRTQAVPAPTAESTGSAQVASIRAAIEEFNRH